jgi:predicted rRNA methylase YqxC with S4 and FtsJ domains
VGWVVGERFRLEGLVESPIVGASGNREFFVLLRNPGVESWRHGLT